MAAPNPAHIDADDERHRLRAALALVEQMAGEQGAPPPGTVPGDGAGRTATPPIARRRFDALAGEAGAFAAAGIAALIRYRDQKGQDCAPAAAQLAREMRQALAQLDRLIPQA
jgi:hypothetical protein